jgi:large subunit ribosomal protein L4
MYRAGMASILSQLVREDRLAVVDSHCRRGAEDQLVCGKRSRDMGYDSVLVITDRPRRERLSWLRATCRMFWFSKSNEADPVSLIRFPKVLMTKAPSPSLRRFWDESTTSDASAACASDLREGDLRC